MRDKTCRHISDHARVPVRAPILCKPRQPCQSGGSVGDTPLVSVLGKPRGHPGFDRGTFRRPRRDTSGVPKARVQVRACWKSGKKICGMRTGVGSRLVGSHPGLPPRILIRLSTCKRVSEGTPRCDKHSVKAGRAVLPELRLQRTLAEVHSFLLRHV